MGAPNRARKQEEASQEAARPLRTPPLQVIAAQLVPIVRKGLPVTHATAGDVLPNLRSVWARAVIPDDYISRVEALNRLLERLLAELADERLADAARVLFALEKHNRGTTLGRRRDVAAEAANYEVTHFRKHIEPKVIELVAFAVRSDSLSYEPRSKKAASRPPDGEISGDTPKISQESFTDQEELLSRLWSAVYGLRAELIAIERTRGDPDRAEQHAYVKDSALWQTARVLTFVHRYIDRYGDVLMHGESQFNAEGVIRLAGWTPDGMTDDQRNRMRLVMAKVGTEERQQFLRGA